MGIPYINAPEEADSQCAYLVKSGIAQSVITEDMDILTFGSNKIYRSLTSYKKPTLEINLDDILEKTDLTYDQFIEFCILLGCDYCERVKDVKPNVIYEYYYKYKNIPDTLNAMKKDNIHIPNLDDYKKYKHYFKFPPVEIIKNPINITKPNIKKLMNILVNEYGLIKSKIYSKIKYLDDNYKHKYKH